MGHGLVRVPEYNCWRSALSRCRNPRCSEYANYGGRGITVCERWLSFENFYADMGPRPSTKHGIDRINNDGNYEPANCRWATIRENNNNRRNTIMLFWEGKWRPLSEVCESSGSDRHVLRARSLAGKIPWRRGTGAAA
jgi:hypothetical protein